MALISDEAFKEMLSQSGLPVRASYRPGEVCRILGISSMTFWRLTERYEIDPDTKEPRDVNSLDSYLLRTHRRVRYNEILNYLNRNNTYERKTTSDPRQMLLFD